jgi:hypothetical protein
MCLPPTPTPNDCLMTTAASGKGDSAKVEEQELPPIKRGLVKSISYSDTASESSTSHHYYDDAVVDNDHDDNNYDDDTLIPHTQGSFGLDASRMVGDTLVLNGFLVRATRHDIYQLRDWLLQHHHCPIIKMIRITGQVAATDFRRFVYKKENVSHHIQALCRAKNILLDYQIQLHIGVNTTASLSSSIDACASVLEEVKKHPEVTTLHLMGRLTTRQQDRILTQLINLLRRNDRDWISVQVVTGFLADAEADAEDQPNDTWRTTMEHYMDVFSQLYSQYNIPIDIQPCAEV